jgi:hypothetical protein
VFHHFIEHRGFEVFHYRHRPERCNGKEINTRCCLIKLQPSLVDSFLADYANRPWDDSNEEALEQGNIKVQVMSSAQVPTQPIPELTPPSVSRRLALTTAIVTPRLALGLAPWQRWHLSEAD